MEKKWVTKQTLLMRAQNKDDAQAWEDFVDYYKDFILIVLRNFNLSSTDLEDLSQDILIKIWKNLDKYTPGRNQFRTWLSTLIRNKFYDFIRKKNNIGRIEACSLDNESTEHLNTLSESDVEDIIDKEWRAYLTNRAMKNIEPIFSGQALEVFNMTLNEVPVSEISAKLDITEGSVYTLRKRFKQRLRAEVKRLRDEIEF